MTDIQHESMGVYEVQSGTLDRFDYGEVDSETAEYLKQCEKSIKAETERYFTAVGKMLIDAQQKLSNHYNGVFERWYMSIGLSKKTAYNLINRYKFLNTLSAAESQMLESLPVTLSYYISSPNAPKDMVDKVLNGEIKSISDYKKSSFCVSIAKEIKGFENTFSHNLVRLKELLAELDDSYGEDIPDDVKTLRDETIAQVGEFEQLLSRRTVV